MLTSYFQGCSPVCSLQPLEQCRLVEQEECTTQHGTKCGKDLADSIVVSHARYARPSANDIGFI